MPIGKAMFCKELLQPDENHNVVGCTLLAHQNVADCACAAHDGSNDVDTHGLMDKHYAKDRLHVFQYTAYVPALLALYNDLE